MVFRGNDTFHLTGCQVTITLNAIKFHIFQHNNNNNNNDMLILLINLLKYSYFTYNPISTMCLCQSVSNQVLTAFCICR